MTTPHDSPDRSADGSPTGVSRRNYVRALGASAGALSIGAATTSGAAAQSSGGFDNFVETDGPELVVDGEEVHFSGSNNFWLTDASSIRSDFEGHKQRVQDILDLFVEMDIDLVRMWANGAGQDGSGNNQLQYEPGVYDEELFEMHDYVIAQAGERGIRIVPSLVDNWTWEGGMAQYGAWATGDSYDPENYTLTDGLHSVFYTDEEARQIYRDHVETVLTRENTYTGMEWREDPTIAWWELANEPRLEANWNYEGGEFDRNSGEHRDILGDWIQEMSQHFKSIDSNHLVSTGSEGHYYIEGGEYPEGTWGAQDYIGHHSYDSIDLASFHWYPDHWWCHADCNDLSQVPLDRGSEWIQTHIQDAHEELGKPAYFGEGNVRAERPNQSQDSLSEGDGHSLSTRTEHLTDWYETAKEVEANAMIVWQIVLESTDDHDGFQIYQSDDAADAIVDFGAWAEEQSGGGGGTGDNCQEFGGFTACDHDESGTYGDFTEDGELGTDDVSEFQEQLFTDGVQGNAESFNFSGSADGTVSHGDVVALFQDATGL